MARTSTWAYSYGHLDVTVAILAPRIADVRAQLLPGLRLAAQTLTPPGTHPLVLMFGQHSHVRPWFVRPGGGGSYDEWIVVTPFVEWTDGRGQVSSWASMSRLYLDSPRFTSLGWIYGYPKELARMVVPPTSYSVRTLTGGEPRVDMQWQSTGAAAPWSSLPNAAALAPLFGQPFIQRLGALPWLGSRMWFELDTATVQPVTLTATIAAGCAPGLAPFTVTAGSIADGCPGAFRVSLDWMLSRPYLGGDLPAGLRGVLPPDCT